MPKREKEERENQCHKDVKEPIIMNENIEKKMHIR